MMLVKEIKSVAWVLNKNEVDIPTSKLTTTFFYLALIYVLWICFCNQWQGWTVWFFLL